MENGPLIAVATAARDAAFAPYSGFAVGAALECADGRIFSGCNVENLSFGLTCCAERVAIFTAVAAGGRDFRTIAIVADTQVPVSPCGACRQVMAEFNPGMRVVLSTLCGRVEEYSLTELLPRPAAGILDSPA
jgi:cytidine deaminase